MKNLVRFAVAGALMAGFATAQAQTPSLPSSGSSDLWLFVADAAAGTSFAEDTGLSLSNLLPGSALASNSTLANVNTTFNVGTTSALTAYINAATAAGQTLDWAVLGGQDPGSTKNGKIEPQGAALLLGSAPISSGANIEQMTVGNLGSALGSLDADISYLNGSYATGGSVYTWTNGTNGGNVWGAGGSSANGGSTNFYNQGNSVTQAGIAIGSSTGLYGFTGNGGTGQLESYVLGDNLTLSSTGALTISNGGSPPPPPVPLPAAVWLFGSGLLGLLGVGRRRAATQA
jgi:hypothetical protein